jgi:cobalt/nickel transport system permease protein
MPVLHEAGATRAQWATAAVLPLVAVAVTSSAWVVR